MLNIKHTINSIIVNNYYTFSPQPTIIILGSRTHKRRQQSFAQVISWNCSSSVWYKNKETEHISILYTNQQVISTTLDLNICWWKLFKVDLIDILKSRELIRIKFAPQGHCKADVLLVLHYTEMRIFLALTLLTKFYCAVDDSTRVKVRKNYQQQDSLSRVWDLQWKSNTTSVWPTKVLTGAATGELTSGMFHRDKLFSPRCNCGRVTVTSPSPNGLK